LLPLFVEIIAGIGSRMGLHSGPPACLTE
jgi:hypothetical protein